MDEDSEDYISSDFAPIIKPADWRRKKSNSLDAEIFPPPMMHTNVTKTRTRARLAISISLFAMLFAVGLMITGLFWIWIIENRETEETDLLNSIQKQILDQQNELKNIKDMLGLTNQTTGRSFNSCQLPQKLDGCKKDPPRWYFDQKTGRCVVYFLGDCDDEERSFATKEDCMKKCENTVDPCNLPSDSGPCGRPTLRYYFDNEESDCLPFAYGGCAGNVNNFLTVEECRMRCKKTEDVCDLEPEIGNCRAAIMQWYHDKTSGECQQFTYGGCGGNGNRFQTKESCMDACNKRTESGSAPPTGNGKERCRLPPQVGLCRAFYQRYFFNATSGQCETFTYGGCNGNENNFETMADCENACQEISE